MPFGNDCEFENFDACVSMHTDNGHSQAEAEAMCGQLMKDTEGKCARKARMDMDQCIMAKMEDGMSESEAEDACMAMMEEMKNAKHHGKKKRTEAGGIERRFVSTEICPVAVEQRDGEEPRLVGYAAVFHVPEEPGTEYQLFPDLKERIMPRAFNRALQEKHDAAALFNHDPNLVLGRVSSGTLRISKDQRGLRYEVKPPATRADVVESIRRGDVKGSSFGFRVLEQKFKSEGNMDVREIHSVELLDVSPTVFPAYKGTTSGVRAIIGDTEEVRVSYQEWKVGEARKAALVAKLAGIKKRADEIAALD